MTNKSEQPKEKSILDFYSEEASDYEVVKASLERLIKQGRPAFKKDGVTCTYYDEGSGDRCGVGVLLPKAEDYADCEGSSSDLIRESEDTNPELYKAMDKYNEVLDALQLLHDSGIEDRLLGYFQFLPNTLCAPEQREEIKLLSGKWIDVYIDTNMEKSWRG